MSGSYGHIRDEFVFRNVLVKADAGNVTLTSDNAILLVNKATGAATSVTLPADPHEGQCIVVKDSKGDAGTNNITIAAGSVNIDGASSLVLSANYARAKLIYNSTIGEWARID